DDAVKAYDKARAEYQKLESAGFESCKRKSVTPRKYGACPLSATPSLADVRKSIAGLRASVDKFKCDFKSVDKAAIADRISTSKSLLADADRYAGKAQGKSAAAKEQLCKGFARFEFAERLCIATGQDELAQIDARCKKRFDDLVAALKDYGESVRRWSNTL